MTNARRVVASLLAVGAVALCLVSFVLDGTTRDTLSSACVVGSLVAAVLAVVLVTRVAQWFGHSRTALAILATGLPVLVGLSWIGGLQRPIESGDAIELITFFAATQTIAAGVLVVVTAIATADLEEAVRLAPGLAVAVRPGPRPEATIPPS